MLLVRHHVSPSKFGDPKSRSKAEVPVHVCPDSWQGVLVFCKVFKFIYVYIRGGHLYLLFLLVFFFYFLAFLLFFVYRSTVGLEAVVGKLKNLVIEDLEMAKL